MSIDDCRAEFEKAFPLPVGIRWDGDHFEADREVIGSYANATVWSHMWRGWRRSREALVVELPWTHYDAIVDEQVMSADQVREALDRIGVTSC